MFERINKDELVRRLAMRMDSVETSPSRQI
jgi:hypothetical protein